MLTPDTANSATNDDLLSAVYAVYAAATRYGRQGQDATLKERIEARGDSKGGGVPELGSRRVSLVDRPCPLCLGSPS
ncbi:hypothetical protein THAOC_30741 [Thalassiosira oceanica]|uniref:Uncharacterized protein n=1 Tax=Thalassiosira oceanica TaxID=159749 RepID=K0R9P4_THAOC|nr:hypothetical protein THAOC_30741 [Thalassiosira oceanica]|eukprot:EJK50313.1 hypothetical protein THAOC_30741 [Thalassiosira oceanica]